MYEVSRFGEAEASSHGVRPRRADLPGGDASPLTDFYLKFYNKFCTFDGDISPTIHVRSWNRVLYDELSRIQSSSLEVLDGSDPDFIVGSCVSPVTQRDGKFFHYFPCRKCLLCQKSRSASWFNRFRIEQAASKFCLFITLTYADEYVSVLSSRDYQLYLKRLRSFGFVFSYALLGEYGPVGGRPHFHILFFVSDVPSYSTFDSPLETLEYFLRSCWNKGIVTIDPVADNRLFYIASYSKSRFVVHDTFFRCSLKHRIGFSGPAFQAVLFPGALGDSVESSSDLPIWSPVVSARDKVDYGVTSESDVEAYLDSFHHESDPVPSCSTAFLDKYLLDLRLSYDKFLARKL